jgi:hypothetical protein
MPAGVPDPNSKIRTIMFCGNISIGSLTISPIPSGSGNVLTVGSGLVEISPTSGNVYCITYITSGSDSFTLTENGNSQFSYTHGATKLIQSDTVFY